MSIALIAALAVMGLVLTLFFIYASSKVSHAVFDGDDDDDPLVVANGLPPARASGRVVVGPAATSGADVPPVLPPQSGARRDETIGVDQARAEVRERIHRYNTREVRR